MKFSSSLLATFFVSLFVVSGAQAATYDDLIVSTTVQAGNVSLTGSDWSSTGTIGVYTDDQGGQHVLPISSTQAGEYLSVGANSTATYTLPQVKTTISFNWGTVDSYNTIKITRADDSSYYVTGDTVLALASTAGLGVSASSDNIYVTLKDLAGIKSITFMDGASNAFEISDISAVPLPAAILLFGSALAGTAAMRRRKAGRAA